MGTIWNECYTWLKGVWLLHLGVAKATPSHTLAMPLILWHASFISEDTEYRPGSLARIMESSDFLACLGTVYFRSTSLLSLTTPPLNPCSPHFSQEYQLLNNIRGCSRGFKQTPFWKDLLRLRLLLASVMNRDQEYSSTVYSAWVQYCGWGLC